MSSIVPNETLEVTLAEASTARDATAAETAAHHTEPSGRTEAGERGVSVEPTWFESFLDSGPELSVEPSTSLPASEQVEDPQGVDLPELTNEDGGPSEFLQTASAVAGVIAALLAVAALAGWI